MYIFTFCDTAVFKNKITFPLTEFLENVKQFFKWLNTGFYMYKTSLESDISKITELMVS